jgi:hypothetical protein
MKYACKENHRHNKRQDVVRCNIRRRDRIRRQERLARLAANHEQNRATEPEHVVESSAEIYNLDIDFIGFQFNISKIGDFCGWLCLIPNFRKIRGNNRMLLIGTGTGVDIYIDPDHKKDLIRLLQSTIAIRPSKNPLLLVAKPLSISVVQLVSALMAANCSIGWLEVMGCKALGLPQMDSYITNT